MTCDKNTLTGTPCWNHLEPLNRISSRGADHTNCRGTLNRAYLVLTIIWIFAGLIYPLYQADELQAGNEQQLKGCLQAANGHDVTGKHCYDLDRRVRDAHDPMHAFETTYGHVRDWPISIFLVCILPPMLCYGLIRFAGVVLSADLPGARSARKQT